MEYTEHKKLEGVQDESQSGGELLEWLENKGIFLAQYVDGHNFPQPYHYNMQNLLAEWKGIDLIKLEAEKRDMLTSIRKTIKANAG